MSRRGQNEGSIFKRRDGRWAATVNLGWQDGKRKRKTFYGRSRREVQEKLSTALSDLQRGLSLGTDRQTLSQFLAQWLDDSVRPTVRPKTYDSYSQLVRLYLAPGLGQTRLSKLTPQHVQNLLNLRLAGGLSPRTVQYIHAVLRRALGQAVRWGLVPRNVATLVDPPRVYQPEVEPMNPDQARAFLDAVRGHRLEALYSVAIALGLRQGETLGLHWRDVDLDERTLRVRVARQRIAGMVQFVEPKSARSRRVIAMPEVTVSALRAHKVRQLEERLQAGEHWHDIGLVFTSTIGTSLEPRNVTRHFHETLSRAGIPHKAFKDLRHTCASLLLAQGVHARVVMEVLGHSQIAVTLNTYSHVFPELKREAAEQMDVVLQSAQ